MFYLASGLSLIFAYSIDSSFRTWNRLSIVIITFALLAIAIQVNRITSKKFMSAIVLMAIAVFTQLTPLKNAGITAEPDKTSIASFTSLETVANLIQEKLPDGCSILQLPIMTFPEGGRVGGVGNGEHLWLPLLTHGFKWSYGAPKGSKAGDYWKEFVGADPALAIQRARELGFCAVLINLNGFTSEPTFPTSVELFRDPTLNLVLIQITR